MYKFLYGTFVRLFRAKFADFPRFPQFFNENKVLYMEVFNDGKMVSFRAI